VPDVLPSSIFKDACQCGAQRKRQRIVEQVDGPSWQGSVMAPINNVELSASRFGQQIRRGTSQRTRMWARSFRRLKALSPDEVRG